MRPASSLHAGGRPAQGERLSARGSRANAPCTRGIVYTANGSMGAVRGAPCRAAGASGGGGGAQLTPEEEEAYTEFKRQQGGWVEGL